MKELPSHLSNKKFHLTLTIFAFVIFNYGWFSANLVMPILPQLTQVFHTKATWVTLSVTAFLAAYACFQLMWGPISDRVGRKYVLLVGFTIAVIGALVAAFSVNVSMFIAARFVEAFGMSCGSVMSRSMLMDIFDQEEITKTMAWAAIIIAAMPAIGPIVGSWISVYFTWHGVLIFLAIYGFLVIISALLALHETNLNLDKAVTIPYSFNIYCSCVCHRRFIGSITLYGLFFGATLGFYTQAPFIFIQRLGISKTTYGLYMLVPVVTYMLGTYSANAIIKRKNPLITSKLGLLFGIISTIIFYVFYHVLPLSILTVVLPIAVFTLGAGLISPSANTMAMTCFEKNKGAAAALIGFAMCIGSSLYSGLVAMLSDPTLMPYLAITSSACILSIITYFFCFFLKGRNQ